MPDFVFEGQDAAARVESDFVLGFLSALFWVGADHLPEGTGYHDLHPESLETIRADCEAWAVRHKELLDMACGPMTGYSEIRAGVDYFLTRDGQGSGFWDREELARDMARRGDGTLTDTGEEEGLPFLDSLGGLLTAAAPYRDTHVFMDGGAVRVLFGQQAR